MKKSGPLKAIFDPPIRYGSRGITAQIGEPPPFGVTINQDPDQNDPTASLPILFQVEFAEAVTGFTASDVTLTGTAGASNANATVVNSGDDIHYTVEVNGPLVGGTVIATIGAGTVASIATTAPNAASTSTDNTVTWVDPLPWFGDSAPGVGPTISPTFTGQSMILAISCITRLNAEESQGIHATVDGYSGNNDATNTAFDGFGGSSAGAPLLGVEFGTRSRMSMRQDWLNMLAGDEYELILNAADHAASTAFYQIGYPWKVKQVKTAASATTSLSVTLDAAVTDENSIVIVAIACLSANSVTVGPTGFTVDGTTDEPTQRTSRVSAYRSIGTDQTGQTTYTATLNSTTGGGAIMAIEVTPTDSLDTALSTAIRAQSGLLAYYPMHHTLGTVERNWGGSLGDLLSRSNFTIANTAGQDGRKYDLHASGVQPATMADNTQYTPNGNGGLTIGCLIRMTSLAAISTIASKNTDAANFTKEWEIYVDTDGSLFAHTNQGSSRPPATARGRRTAASTIATSTWYLVIIRFGNGANDFPTIRINGSNHTGTTSGSTAAAGATGATPTVGATYQGSTTRAFQGAIGHFFTVTTDISDSDCSVIEAAAQADGWF